MRLRMTLGATQEAAAVKVSGGQERDSLTDPRHNTSSDNGFVGDARTHVTTDARRILWHNLAKEV